ncbi:MAG: hypothetical protein JSW72_02425 [Candidatus Bathyarchaeota archaeon]|nr:MAG: hypothetical protein JSW72_02425 [Candidatus Bathyarchaeota archaeon]
MATSQIPQISVSGGIGARVHFPVVDAKPFIAFPTVGFVGITMRAYIFTDRERRIIQRFLSGRIMMTNRDLSKIRSRMKHFEKLKNDVFLYLELWDMVLLETAEPGAKTSR